jgi:isopenicillin N synthase-like dioxygenase
MTRLPQLGNGSWPSCASRATTSGSPTSPAIASDPEPESRLLVESRRFLALPAAEREALAIANSAAFRGYTSVGDERTQGRVDWRDQLDFGPEQEPPPAGSDGPAWLRVRGPNQWPASLPDLQILALTWLDKMLGLGIGVMRAPALGPGQPIDTFDSAFIPNHDLHAKIIRYPAGNAASEQGVGLHHDSGLLTFILQRDVAGLEVQLGDEMVLVEPHPDAYVMNLGAMMQTATDGYARTDRVDLKGEAIHTLFGENNLKVRLRSHPDVAARHYADMDV